jgi:hypothetical protein
LPTSCLTGWEACQPTLRHGMATRIRCLDGEARSRGGEAEDRAAASKVAATARAPHGRLCHLAAFKCMSDSRCHWIWRGAREFRARQHCIRINLECDGDQRQGENDGHGSHGRIVARDLGKIGETFRQKAEVKGSSAALFYQLGAKMKCDKCGKRPERYYPAKQSDTPGFVRRI